MLAVLASLSGTAAFAGDHPTPLQQMRDGVDPVEVDCEPGLALVIRGSADAACVSPASAATLSERGWSLVREAVPADESKDEMSMTGESKDEMSMTDESNDESMTDESTSAMSTMGISEAYSPGPFAVGAVANFVTDSDRPFDAWGRVYKSDEYRDMLDTIDESGQRSTVPTMIYYPAVPGEGQAGRAGVYPAPLLAASQGERSTVLDLYMGNADLARNNMAGQDPSYQYNSYVGAELADGNFPLVVMIHGLGGGLMTWNQAAEYLASHGYVVTTLAYTSDSVTSPVFEDPESPFASSEGADVKGAYDLRANAFSAVFINFMSMMYGYEGDVSFNNLPDPSTLSAIPGGGVESGRMMGDLFEQRVADLQSVIDAMTTLGAPADECRDTLERDGLCGFFEGAIDSENIGVMGHSLGSMTSQSALEFVPEVDTAVAFNNGMPKRWEPFGGLPDLGMDPPAGVPKDILFVIGSDDFFIYNVFSEIHLRWYETAGGDLNDTYPLAAEQQRPSPDNPQPVARSAYERAQAAKVLVTFRDQGHSDATDDAPGWVEPGSTNMRMRVPLSDDAQPEPYNALAWVEDGGGQVYLPHQMRNYFATAWFDWQLKGDDSQRQAVLDHPFENGVQSLISRGLEN